MGLDPACGVQRNPADPCAQGLARLVVVRVGARDCEGEGHGLAGRCVDDGEVVVGSRGLLVSFVDASSCDVAESHGEAGHRGNFYVLDIVVKGG